MRRRWLDAARTALAGNDVTFAMLKPDGPLAALPAEGYAIDVPE